MNHYLKIGLAVCGGVIGAEGVKLVGKRIASMVSAAAAKVAASAGEDEEETPAEEAPQKTNKKDGEPVAIPLEAGGK